MQQTGKGHRAYLDIGPASYRSQVDHELVAEVLAERARRAYAAREEAKRDV